MVTWIAAIEFIHDFPHLGAGSVAKTKMMSFMDTVCQFEAGWERSTSRANRAPRPHPHLCSLLKSKQTSASAPV